MNARWSNSSCPLRGELDCVDLDLVEENDAPDQELAPECVCLWRPSPYCEIHGDLARKGLDFDGRPQGSIGDARKRTALW
jgi:hypothetical protein